jgi:hypothetical protein
LLTLDSLANAVSFEVGASWMDWRPTANAAAQREVCLELLRVAAKTLEEAAKISDAKPLVCDRDDFATVSYRTRFDAARTLEQRQAVCAEYALSQLKAPDMVPCTAEALPAVSPAERHEAAIHWGTPWQLGLRTKVGYRDLTWAETADGATGSDQVVPWEISFGGNVVACHQVVVGGEYRIVSDVQEQKKRSVCLPLDGNERASSCRELPFGRFKDVRRHVVTGFARKWVGIMAADVRVSYDVENDAGSVEVPVSFVATDRGLTVGVAAGWTSEDDAPNNGWSVRAFVGDLLKLWPGR